MWILNGQKDIGFQTIQILNGIWNPKAKQLKYEFASDPNTLPLTIKAKRARLTRFSIRSTRIARAYLAAIDSIISFMWWWKDQINEFETKLKTKHGRELVFTDVYNLNKNPEKVFHG